MEKSLFERVLFEAPGDDAGDPPPEAVQAANTAADDTTPDDTTADNGVEDPPDIGNEDDLSADDDNGDPPDLGMDDDGNELDDNEDNGDNNDEDQGPEKPKDLSDKVSAIMNVNLYQKFLSMLNTISNQLTAIKDNSDMIYSLSPDALDIISSLKKLDENIHIYLKNNFANENYSKNLLFFNKCLNLLKLLNDSFDSDIHKGIKTTSNN